MPVSGPTRELAITYNSYQVGGSTGRQIHGFSQQSVSKDRAAISFDVIVTASTESAFAAACSAIEAAYSTPYKDLTVALGSSSLIAVTQNGNTGLDAIATIEKPGGPPDSGRSRRYRVRIEYGLPASWATTPGLRDSHVALSKGPQGRALVTLRGTFTAISGNDAKAQHDAQIDTWAAAQKTWLGITTWQLVEVGTVEVSVNRKTCEFSRTYIELFATQGAASVVRQSLVVTRIRRGSEYSPQAGAPSGGTTDQAGNAADVVPLTDISATYEAWIDKSVTTDLKSTWAALESFVIAQIAVELGTSSFGMISAAPSYHVDQNQITAIVTGVAADVDASAIVQNVFEQSTRRQPGYEFLPVWSGNPLEAIVQPGQEVLVRTTTRRWRTLGSISGGSLGVSSGGGSGSGAGGGGWGAIGYVGQGIGSSLAGAEYVGSPIAFGNYGSWQPTLIPDANGNYSNPGGTVIGSPGSGSGGGASGGADLGAIGAGGSGWYPIDSDQGSRPLAIGRRPFVIYLTERWSTLIERYAVT